MKILFLTKYSEKGPSSRYRTFQYIPYFESNGIECTVSPLFNDAYLVDMWNGRRTDYLNLAKQYFKRLLTLLRARRYDYLFIEYELFSYFPPLVEEFLSLLNVKYILDYDDAIFHNYDLNNNRFVRKLLTNKIPAILKEAHAVITGSPYLTEFARRYNKNVHEIPTAVDIHKYLLAPGHTASEEFIVGWLGSKTTSKYVVDILPALQRFLQDFPAKLRMMGFDEQLLSTKNPKIEVLRWEASKENEYLNSIHVGIMPLRNTPWEKGKCGFKLIQFMACAKPFIASPLPANLKIDRNNTALFADSQEEWYNALKEVYQYRQKFETIGQANRKVVEEYYSLQVNAPEYLAIFNSR